MFKRLGLVLGVAVLLTLALSSLALAATPQEIYDDYADNGKLDAEYSCQDLKSVVEDATLSQYGDTAIMDALQDIYTKQCRDQFPYTGFQIAIAVVVAIILIGGGIALRFFTRRNKPQNQQ